MSTQSSVEATEQIYPTVLIQLCACLGKYAFGCNRAESSGTLKPHAGTQGVPVYTSDKKSWG